MKYVRFKEKGIVASGILTEDIILKIKGGLFSDSAETGGRVKIEDAELLSPVVPSKIVAVGLNYADHARELKMQLPVEPLIFLKPPSAVIGPSRDIYYPSKAQRVDYEAELAIVIKRRGRNIPYEMADDYIFGYTCLNDVTARDLQKKDGQWTRAKSFDTFAPIGPCIATDIDPSRLRIKTFLNGKLRQSGNTANMIFPVPALLRYISHVMTLIPGDIITTGTPSGVGPMSPGDRVDVQIEGIGTLSNRVMRVKS